MKQQILFKKTKPESEIKKTYALRLTDKERAELQAKADAKHLTLAAYIRMRLFT